MINKILLKTLLVLALTSCTTHAPKIDRPAANSALDDIRRSGVSIISSGCSQQRRPLGIGEEPIYQDESLAVGNAWALTTANHLSQFSIPASPIKAAELCSIYQATDVPIRQSRNNKAVVASTLPHYVDPAVSGNSDLQAALEMISCQIQQAGYTGNLGCITLLTAAEKTALLSYANNRRYVLFTHGRQSIPSTGALLGDFLFDFATNIAGSIAGVAVGGTLAVSGADPLVTRAAVSATDNAYYSDSEDRLHASAALIDTQTGKALWVSPSYLPAPSDSVLSSFSNPKQCGAVIADSRVANDVFKSLLCP